MPPACLPKWCIVRLQVCYYFSSCLGPNQAASSLHKARSEKMSRIEVSSRVSGGGTSKKLARGGGQQVGGGEEVGVGEG